MADRISGRQFDESPGVEDWRALWGGGFACTYFETGSFGAGAALVQAISELPAVANHHVDVDLRPEGVTVRLFTHDPGGLSDRDAELAREISAAARKLDISADPSGVQHVQEIGDEDVLDPHRGGPPFTFQQMDAPRPQRNRIHVDVYVPRDQAEARIAAALAAGGHIVNDTRAPNWWTLADAEDNEVDIAIWG